MQRSANYLSSGLLLPLALLTALTGFSPVWGSCDSVDPLVIVPVSEACAGWECDGDLQTANNIEELTVVINGGAYLFEQYGFVSGAFQDFSGLVDATPVLISVKIFNQGTPENAINLFNDDESGSDDPVDEWSGSGLARLRTNFGMVVLNFQEECFYVIITSDTGGDGALPSVICLANKVLDLIYTATPVTSNTWGRMKHLFYQ